MEPMNQDSEAPLLDWDEVLSQRSADREAIKGRASALEAAAKAYQEGTLDQFVANLQQQPSARSRRKVFGPGSRRLSRRQRKVIRAAKVSRASVRKT